MNDHMTDWGTIKTNTFSLYLDCELFNVLGSIVEITYLTALVCPKILIKCFPSI